MRRAFLISLVCLGWGLALPASVLRLKVDQMIHPISDEFIERGLAQAVRGHDSAVIIELSTPGGLLDSTRSIVEKIMTSPVPVIVYVGPTGSRAASAGFFLLESADLAVMAPGTNTGAAHPVLPGVKMDDVMKEKIENDAAAFMRTIAFRRGRNVAVAESAVRQSRSFTEQEALNLKLIDFVAADVPALLKAVDGRTTRRYNGTTSVLHVSGAEVHDYEMTLKERLLGTLMDPNIAFLLLALGSLALFAEFNHPGAVIPGVTGIISILLALFALNLLPTRFAALSLVGAAFVLFALEAKFVTHGILAIGGTICMILGALFLVDGPIPEMRVHLGTALAVSLPVALIATALAVLVFRARRAPVATGKEGMIGEIGVARTMLGLDGKVFVHGELWNAVATIPVDVGTRVRVRSLEGLRLLVEPLE
jgi:Membrane-bound serine protease (ClpP class)